VVVPCAGGSLITKIHKAFKELRMLGLIPEGKTSMYAAQAAGCGPIVTMIKKDSDVLEPVRPNTIAKSLAIGNPADGYYAYRVAKDTGAMASTRRMKRSSKACSCSPAPKASSRRRRAASRWPPPRS
jgi:threonine synthase